MDNPTVSFIIPLFNAEAYIGKCLDSILCQSLDIDSYEIVLVDDGSTDNTIAKVLEWKKNKSCNISIITQEKSGPGISRNAGIAKANGKYILFIDADDYYEPESLKSCLDFAIKEDLDICFFDYDQIYDNTVLPSSCITNSSDSWKVMTGPNALITYYFHSYVWDALFKTAFIKDNFLLFTSIMWGEDILFTTKSLLCAKRVARLDVLCYHYNRSNQNSITFKSCKDRERLVNIGQSRIYVSEQVMQMATESGTSEPCKKMLIDSANVYLYYAFFMLLKGRVDNRKLKEIISTLKEKGMYPIKKFEYLYKRRIDDFIIWLINKRCVLLFVNRLLNIV